MNSNQIGLQLYTVRDQTAQDMIGTLRRLAEIGYRAVEFAGYGNASVADVRAALDEYGMQAIGAHVALTKFQTDAQQVFADLQTLGCQYAIVPSVPEDQRGSVAAVQKLAETLNGIGAQCQAEGLQFAYHNHNFEFAPLEGTTMYDVLLDEIDPSVVKLELDVFWVQRAGRDPVEMLQRLAGQVPLLHVKDMAADESDAPVGEGNLPWERILRVATGTGTEWYIVEQDHPQQPIENVTTSLRNLKALAGQQ